MSENIITQITLDCLLNKEVYEKMQHFKKQKNINKKDKKFYRKRILNLTRELLLKKDDDYSEINPDIKFCFDNYVKTCIQYFKIIDNNDIIQSEYKDMEFPPEIGCNVNDVSGNVVDADKLLMRSIKIDVPTLDKYVTRISTKKKEEIILPKQKVINLNDPELKIKGLKKNNITNIYEDKKTKKTDEEK